MGTRQAVLTCTHNLCFEQKYENSQKIKLKIIIFTAVKNRCILHGRVFEMLKNNIKISVKTPTYSLLLF